MFKLLSFLHSYDKPSINSFRCRSSLFNDIFSKLNQLGHMTTWETLLKLIWSYGEVFEFTPGLMKTKKANAICVRALEKLNHFSNLYSITTLHFNAWRRMEFPSSDVCLEDFRHAKDKKLQQSETFRQLYSWQLLIFFLRLQILIVWRTQRGTN